MTTLRARWPWPRRRRRDRVTVRRLALAPLTLGRYLAALRALGLGLVADGAAGEGAVTTPDFAALPLARLQAFLDAVPEEGGPEARLVFTTEDALREHAALRWAAVALEAASAGETAKAQAEVVERYHLHYLQTYGEDDGPLPPPLVAVLARLDGADYAAVTALPIEDALCYLAARAVALDYDRSQREGQFHDDDDGFDFDEDVARN